jgi:TalC/MipB family fructose-6-phosphate aldolase
MKLYLDTANIKEIEEGASLGLIDGITTNPSLVVKEGRSFQETLRDICRLVDGPISAEVVETESEAMIKEGRELAKIHTNIVVKVPLIMEGLRATRALAAEGIKVNVTLCFSPTQALLAAKAGAWCVSPFIGRLDDISSDGMDPHSSNCSDVRHLSVRDPSARGKRAKSAASRGCRTGRGPHLHHALFGVPTAREASADRLGLEEVFVRLGEAGTPVRPAPCRPQWLLG